MLTVDFSKMNLKPGARVLDAGCGPGRHLSEAFRRNGVQVVGIDINPEDVVKTRNILRIMDNEGEGGKGPWGVCVGDITKLPYPDVAFDVVICSEVLEHIPDDRQAIDEIIRVLKPGGLLAVSVPRFFPESICWALSKSYRNEPGGHIRLYKKYKLIKLLESAGVSCISAGWAHALHSPYWWLKCVVGPKNKNHWLVRLYHQFLVWDIVKRPWLTQIMERLLNPLIAKSCTLYLKKERN
jgi:ubiquinone/menaquinone biosynthesis C-methylase UbiE